MNLKLIFQKTVVMGILLSSVSAFAIPPTYPLVCRGGGKNLYGLSSTWGAFVEFIPGTAKASLGLKKGQCSWVDRGFGPGEPGRLCRYVNNFYIAFTAQKGHGYQFVNASVPQATDFAQFYTSSPGTTFQFNVYNDGMGCMRVVP